MRSNEYPKEYNEQAVVGQTEISSNNNDAETSAQAHMARPLALGPRSSSPIAERRSAPGPFQIKLQYSREESATMLGISLRTLDRLIAEKRLPVRRVGRRVLITRDNLTQFTRRDHQTVTIQ